MCSLSSVASSRAASSSSISCRASAARSSSSAANTRRRLGRVELEQRLGDVGRPRRGEQRRAARRGLGRADAGQPRPRHLARAPAPERPPRLQHVGGDDFPACVRGRDRDVVDAHGHVRPRGRRRAVEQLAEHAQLARLLLVAAQVEAGARELDPGRGDRVDRCRRRRRSACGRPRRADPVRRGGPPGSIVTTMSCTRPMRSPAGSLTGRRRSCDANILTGGSPP